jgi:hypothetical protein
LLTIWKLREFRCKEALARDWTGDETEAKKKGDDDDDGGDEEDGEAIMANLFNARSSIFCGARPHFKFGSEAHEFW